MFCFSIRNLSINDITLLVVYIQETRFDYQFCQFFRIETFMTKEPFTMK